MSAALSPAWRARALRELGVERYLPRQREQDLLCCADAAERDALLASPLWTQICRWLARDPAQPPSLRRGDERTLPTLAVLRTPEGKRALFEQLATRSPRR